MSDSVQMLPRPRQWPQDDPGASGVLAGTNGAASLGLDAFGWSGLWKGWLLIACLLAGSVVVNALTARADYPRAAAWEPWVWEGTSTAVLMLLAWLPAFATLIASPRLRTTRATAWIQVLAMNAGGALVFSGLHVTGMMVLRKGLYAMVGASYRVGPIADRFVYEFRKDLLTYAIFAAVFLLAGKKRETSDALPVSGDFDIVEGNGVLRTAASEILAAMSAGNYVEFILADGRRPLMRVTLTAVQVELERSGFVRTHRSWLVNSGRVRGLRSQGSGDWVVELENINAPLSRRYPDALAVLKRSPPRPANFPPAPAHRA